MKSLYPVNEFPQTQGVAVAGLNGVLLGNELVAVLDRWLHIKWLDYGVLKTTLLVQVELGLLHAVLGRLLLDRWLHEWLHYGVHYLYRLS